MDAITRHDAPVAAPGWTVEDAVAAMPDADLGQLPVADDDGTFVGIVSLNDAIRVDEILRHTRPALTATRMRRRRDVRFRKGCRHGEATGGA